MNGTDWPSPAANLSLVEQQINELLAATGIDVPSLATGILFESFSALYDFSMYTLLVLLSYGSLIPLRYPPQSTMKKEK